MGIPSLTQHTRKSTSLLCFTYRQNFIGKEECMTHYIIIRPFPLNTFLMNLTGIHLIYQIK